MKWYWVLLIVVILGIIIYGVVIVKKANEFKASQFSYNVVKKPCNQNQVLARPPESKEWCCFDGNWQLVDKKGTPQNGGINSPGILAPGCEALTK